mmetsp:Transcript_33863/g.74015  ORF Transcript_33863/g.74015 Transcript_33863/m.74015 type:complete len:238 (+) Transcript_33863:961-1674(+)
MAAELVSSLLSPAADCISAAPVPPPLPTPVPGAPGATKGAGTAGGVGGCIMGDSINCPGIKAPSRDPSIGSWDTRTDARRAGPVAGFETGCPNNFPSTRDINFSKFMLMRCTQVLITSKSHDFTSFLTFVSPSTNSSSDRDPSLVISSKSNKSFTFSLDRSRSSNFVCTVESSKDSSSSSADSSPDPSASSVSKSDLNSSHVFFSASRFSRSFVSSSSLVIANALSTITAVTRFTRT